MALLVSAGAAKHMAMVHKNCPQMTIGAFLENSLPVVSVSSTNVHQPCKPKVLKILYPLEAAVRKDFEEPEIDLAQETRPETPACGGTKASRARLNPASRVSLNEFVADLQYLPRRNREFKSPIELGGYAFVESQVRSLKVVGKFNYINTSIAGFGQYRLRTSPKNANIFG
ncbi:MAG TPA: hypothetical protein VMX38_06005 [Verrucomicrobiae bacterium]|nr:hypothetical protein [Verrucomicrobiae bacterium]